MKEITITCDRCGKVVHGGIDETLGITAGFYDVSGTAWGQYARWEEERVCDDCMHADPKYKKTYSIPLTSSYGVPMTASYSYYKL